MTYIAEGREVEIGGIDGGNVFNLDLANLPEGFTVDHWLEIMKNQKVMFINSDESICTYKLNQGAEMIRDESGPVIGYISEPLINTFPPIEEFMRLNHTEQVDNYSKKLKEFYDKRDKEMWSTRKDRK